MVSDMWMLDRVARSEADRDRWGFVPFERVGPLAFGMTPDEAMAVLGVAAAGARLSGPASERRLLLYDAGINVYFDDEFGLACVAVDAFDGPQVVAPDGFALVGRMPSQVRPWVLAQVEALGTYWTANECMDVAIEEIGLVLRVQRAGDGSLTRPLFVARPWFDDELGYPHTPDGRIPDFEFRHIA